MVTENMSCKKEWLRELPLISKQISRGLCESAWQEKKLYTNHQRE